MSYLEKNLLPNERIIFRTQKHFIIFFFPFIWTLFSFYASNYLYQSPLLMKLTWIPWFMACIFWSYVGLEYAFSEFAVTNKRVMMREGFFHRHCNEMRLSAISQVNIDQTLLGQVLNYGAVSINAFGAFDSYTMISCPFKFQKSVNEQIDKTVSNIEK